MNKEVIEQKIQEIVQKIIKKYQPEKIILFGSWAWGTPHEDSDIDLLVIKETHKSRIERQREVKDMIIFSQMPVDVLVHTPSELEESINKKRNLFLEDIVHNGKVLYTKHGFHISLLHEPAELVEA